MLPGEYIVFCNPMRHFGDCPLWINHHEVTYAKGGGLMAASTKLMLNLGRDFDGDFVPLISSKEYPNLTEDLANFSEPPQVKKLPKVSLVGTLQQVAVNSMNDSTGIVASYQIRPSSSCIHLSVLELCVLERTPRFNHSNATGIHITSR